MNTSPGPAAPGITITGVTGLPEVGAGADLARLIADAAPDLADGDIVVITSKIVSKAEDDFVLVRGAVVLLNVRVEGTVRFYIDGTDAQLKLTGKPPANWNLGDSFASLKKKRAPGVSCSHPASSLIRIPSSRGTWANTLRWGTRTSG